MKLKEKQKAILLRKKGLSYNEILEHISVSKATLSLWLKDLVLDTDAQKRLEKRYTLGQLKSVESSRNKTLLKEKNAQHTAQKVISNISFDKNNQKLILGTLFWCEGTKNIRDSLSFTNSDPEMIRVFLLLLRNSFNVDERKFRICVHLHSYHKKDTVLQYWSKITNIPLSQFIKPYLKKTNGVYKKDGYQGCIRIVYNDVSLARELVAIRDVFIQEIKKGP